MPVADAMLPASGFVTPEQELFAVYSNMRMENLDQILVVDSAENMRGVGILDRRCVEIAVENELLIRFGEREKMEAEA